MKGLTIIKYSAKHFSEKKPKFLVTGCRGQIGSTMTNSLMKRFGVENVVCSDMMDKWDSIKGEYEKIDVTNHKAYESAVVRHKVDYIIHLPGILSVTGENNPQLAIKVNVNGVNNVLEIAKDHNAKVFIPSSIAVYGAGIDRENTLLESPLNPTTVYGVTKVYMEQLGNYYHNKFGVDFRSIRYPGFISPYEYESHGTTDYSSMIFFAAMKKQKYNIYLAETTKLPMLYLTDGIEASLDFLLTDNEKLTSRVYNINGLSFTCKELVEAMKKKIDFEYGYDVDHRNDIALSWPADLDCELSVKDWNMKMEIDTPDKLVDIMLKDMAKYKKKTKI